MRQVATFADERSARLFADVLCSRAVDVDVSKSSSGSWDVWVLEEKHVEASRAAYAAFDANPSAAEHLDAAGCVEKKAHAQGVLERRSRHDVARVPLRFPTSESGRGRLSTALVVISVTLTLVVNLGHRDDIRDLLEVGSRSETSLFADVARGQVWRLVTPIFLHGGLFHLLLNMWLLVGIGSALETRLGTGRYLGLVLASAVLPNVAQYYWSGSLFGGMSGVIYSLFAYRWGRGRMDPTFGLTTKDSTAVVLLVFLLLGFVGGSGVANACHIGGLVLGAALAAFASLRARRA